MPKTLVLFSSHGGRTAALADAIAEGAASVRFAEVEVRRLPALPTAGSGPAGAEQGAGGDALARRYRLLESARELADYDALVLGAATRGGAMAGEMDQLLREAASLFAGGRLADKAGSAFTTVPDGGGGWEETLWSIMKPMAAMGMVLVPAGEAGAGAGAGTGSVPSPLGATWIGEGEPGSAELAVARRQGERVAKFAAMVAHVRSHHHH